MYGDVTRPQRACDSTADVHIEGLEGVRMPQALQLTVRSDRLAVTAWDELHAAHLDTDVLNGDPEVCGDQGRIERVRFVLVPGGRPAVERRLVDRVVEAVHDRPAKQDLGQLAAPPESQRVPELRFQRDGLVDLQNFRGFANASHP